jgi:hypothetical protein
VRPFKTILERVPAQTLPPILILLMGKGKTFSDMVMEAIKAPAAAWSSFRWQQ